MSGDFEAMALYAGQGAGRITSVPPAADRLNAMVSEAKRILGIAEGAATSIDVRIKRIYEKPVSQTAFASSWTGCGRGGSKGTARRSMSGCSTSRRARHCENG